jgi:hypothetical protein
MLSRLGNYTIELVILVLTGAAGIVELFAFSDHKLGFLVVVVGLLMTATGMLLRQEIERNLQDDLSRVVASIAQAWRPAADDELSRLRAQLQEWADGRRELRDEEGVPYQVKLLDRAKDTVDAIHLVSDEDDLYRWDMKQSGFHPLVQANEQLRARARRVFILKDDDPSLVNTSDMRRRIVDEQAIAIFKRQIAPRSDDGLGADVRVRWRSALQSKLPPDLLIVDSVEVVEVREAGGGYEYTAMVGQTRVHQYESLFENLWASSTPVTELLPDTADGAVRPAHEDRGGGGTTDGEKTTTGGRGE